MPRRFLPILPLCLVSVLAGCPGTPTTPTGSARPANAVGGLPQPITPMPQPSAAPAPTTSPLQAADIDDNIDFPAYLRYLAAYRGGGVRAIDVSKRVVIQVSDAAQKGVPDAEVTILFGPTVLWQGRTGSDGRLLYFPSATQDLKFTIQVRKGEELSSTTPDPTATTWPVTLTQTVDRSLSANLDLMFVLDATGSMGDEIGRLQQSIQTVSQRVRELNGNRRLRLGLVSYTDRNESQPVSLVPFTENLTDFQASLNNVKASGGGDYAEDLETGLDAAIQQPSWSTEGATRLAFVVADAPPHVDYGDARSYGETIRRSVQKGIKLYTLGASGLNGAGEYVFRQLAQQTLAKYLFLTYGGQTPAGGGVSANVGAFQENNLDDLIVGIVRQELAPLQP